MLLARVTCGLNLTRSSPGTAPGGRARAASGCAERYVMVPFGSRVTSGLEESLGASWGVPVICVVPLPDFPDSGEHATRPAAAAATTEK